MSEIAVPQSPAVQPTRRTRRWPAVLLVLLGLAAYFSIRLYELAPEWMPGELLFMLYGIGPSVCALLLLLWYLPLGPGRFSPRLALVSWIVVLCATAWMAAHPSAREYWGKHALAAAAALAVLAFVFWPGRSLVVPSVLATVLMLVPLVPMDLVYARGVTGSFEPVVFWRWMPEPETQALAYFGKQSPTAASPGAVAPDVGPGDWPGFRGADRSGATEADVGDWAKCLPHERWRHLVGPAWSSVCVVGDLLFTQEQRDKKEVVVCYRAATGEQVWAHAEEARHEDVRSGAGPRATPTYHAGKVFTLGGTGIVNVLDAVTGQMLWRVDLKEIAGVSNTDFGLVTSPLVVGDKVILHPGSKTGPRLVALAVASGSKLWAVGPGDGSYSSPQLVTLHGVPQVLVYVNEGLCSHDPASGEELWKFSWPVDDFAAPVAQPQVLPGERIVLGGSQPTVRTKCVQVSRDNGRWSVQEVWQAKFTPGFNDFVHLQGNLYGLDNEKLVCLDAATGEVRWKGGKFGHGQVLRVGPRLLVQAEQGDVVLVNPSPDRLQEVARLKALTARTWNHPVVAGGRLYVRNDQEMACFNLP
jgi:outer membrane protein assembly factor BamB